jgi:alkanesulfonate monooxygenase SsuD/methylene tetrahydromethanopterin reductase-like flavin-dependent oxidoreductase (luciferase family)
MHRQHVGPAGSHRHAAATQLAPAYPGRFVLGLGVGYPQQAARVGHDFGSPVATARAYLHQLQGASYPRILAANGPLMLGLAAELADGARDRRPVPIQRPPHVV